MKHPLASPYTHPSCPLHPIPFLLPHAPAYQCKFRHLYTSTNPVHPSLFALDDKLTWTPHINQDTAESTRPLNFVRRNVRVASQSAKETAYKSLLRPALDYACTVWGPYTAVLTNTVEMVQCRAAHYVCSRYHNTSSVSGMIEQLEERRAKY